MQLQILQQLPNLHYEALNIDTQKIVEVKKCTNKNCLDPYKLLDQFRNNISTYDGLQSWCTDCKTIADKRSKTKYKIKNAAAAKQYRNGTANYDSFSSQLSYADQVRNNNSVLETKCTYCDEWFIPNVTDVRSRIRALNGQAGYAEHRFYCSQLCKDECPAYNYKGGDPNRSFTNDLVREVQPDLRKLVFIRDDYICQTCNKHKSELDVPLHCHHDEGIRWEPLESADIDRCSTQCKNCHNDIHSKEGCKYHEFRCPEEFRVSL